MIRTSGGQLFFFLISFSFSIGAVAHILSESFIRKIPFLSFPSDLFAEMVLTGWITSESRPLAENEAIILGMCIEKIEDIYGLDSIQSLDENNRHNIGIIYQILVSETWEQGTPVQLLFNIRMMSRSLLVISLTLIPIGSALSSATILGYLNYELLYQPYVSHYLFIIIYSTALFLIAMGFAVGQQKFGKYQIIYMMIAYLGEDPMG